MRHSGDIHQQLEDTELELSTLIKYMKLNGFGSMNIYSNPYTADVTPGVTFAEMIAFYIGSIDSLKYSLFRKVKYEKK